MRLPDVESGGHAVPGSPAHPAAPARVRHQVANRGGERAGLPGGNQGAGLGVGDELVGAAHAGGDDCAAAGHGLHQRHRRTALEVAGQHEQVRRPKPVRDDGRRPTAGQQDDLVQPGLGDRGHKGRPRFAVAEHDVAGGWQVRRQLLRRVDQVHQAFLRAQPSHGNDQNRIRRHWGSRQLTDQLAAQRGALVGRGRCEDVRIGAVVDHGDAPGIEPVPADQQVFRKLGNGDVPGEQSPVERIRRGPRAPTLPSPRGGGNLSSRCQMMGHDGRPAEQPSA